MVKMTMLWCLDEIKIEMKLTILWRLDVLMKEKLTQ